MTVFATIDPKQQHADICSDHHQLPYEQVVTHDKEPDADDQRRDAKQCQEFKPPGKF